MLSFHFYHSELCEEYTYIKYAANRFFTIVQNDKMISKFTFAVFHITFSGDKKQKFIYSLGIKEQMDTITNRYNKWLYLFHISSC